MAEPKYLVMFLLTAAVGTAILWYLEHSVIYSLIIGVSAGAAATFGTYIMQ